VLRKAASPLKAVWPLLAFFAITRVVVSYLAAHPDLYAAGGVTFDVVAVYQHWAESVISAGNAAYSNVAIEYPPGSLPFIFLPELISPEHYLPTFVTMMVVVDLVGFVGLYFLARRWGSMQGPWLWALAIPLLGPLSYTRLDLVPAVLLIWAFEFATRKEWGVTGGLMGFAALAKVYPALIIPSALIMAKRKKRFLAGIVVAVGLPLLPLLGSIDSIWNSVVIYHMNRGIQVESIWGSALFVNHLLGRHVQLVSDFGAWHFHVPDPMIENMAFLLTLGAVALTIRWAYKSTEKSPQRLAVMAFTVLLLSISVSTVFSPQFMLWLIGGGATVACIASGRVHLAPFLLLPAALLTQIVFPFNYSELLGFEPLAVWTLVIRNVLVLSAAAVALISFPREVVQITDEKEGGQEKDSATNLLSVPERPPA
jgi:hypothetical protein